jgi:hypothetical protein
MTAKYQVTAKQRRPDGRAQGRSDRRKRTLHLVDIENLCRDGFPDHDAAVSVLSSYTAAAELGSDDFGFASANRHLTKYLAYDLPDTLRWVPGGTGPDAAERALLEYADSSFVARRYDRVVIGSGDHAFADLANALVAAGREVVVVAVDGSLSRRLRSAASSVVLLPAA